MRELNRITYVEDDVFISKVACVALEKLAGFEVHMCESGIRAVAETPDFDPDLILLDVMMPGMDGIETFRRLRESPGTKETPIVFMTAKAQAHEVEAYMAMGALDVVTKPFDPVDLPNRLREIWKRVPS